MTINFIAIAIATILQFVAGFIWYGPLFGKIWAKIHCFDKYSKEEQAKMMKEMGPYYAAQILMTIITTVVLALFMKGLPDTWNPYGIAAFMWLGFVLPTQVSGVIFGGTDKQWIGPKIGIQAGAALICLEIAATVLHFIP